MTGGCLLKLLRDDGGALSFTSEGLVALIGSLDENFFLLLGVFAIGLVNNIAGVEALSFEVDEVVVSLNLLENLSVRELEVGIVAMLPVHTDFVPDERQAFLLLEASFPLVPNLIRLLCSTVSASVALTLSIHVLAARSDRLL